jgi:hypothetical protein
LIDFVGDGGDQFTHGREPRHPGQLRLRDGQGALRLFARTDVFNDHCQPWPLPVNRGNQRNADVGPEEAAIFLFVAFLHVIVVDHAVEQAMDVLLGHRPLGFLGNIDERNANDVGIVVAKHSLQGRIGRQNPPFPVGQRDADRRVFVQPLPAALRYLQGDQAILQGFSAGDETGGQFANVGSL